MSEKIKDIVCEICGKAHSTESHQEMVEQILKFNNTPENRKTAEQKGPAVQDIIRVRGRWAQVFSEGEYRPVRWLDDGTGEHIDLKNLKLKKLYGTSVSNLKNLFSKEELSRIHWQAEQNLPHLQEEVTVFGEYSDEEGGDKTVENEDLKG